MSSMQRIHSSSMRISFLRRGETKRFYFLPIQRGYFNDISKKVQFVIFRYRGKSERVRSEFNLLNQKKIHAIRIFLSFQRKEWVRKNPKLQLDPTRILLVKLSATFEF